MFGECGGWGGGCGGGLVHQEGQGFRGVVGLKEQQLGFHENIIKDRVVYL